MNNVGAVYLRDFKITPQCRHNADTNKALAKLPTLYSKIINVEVNDSQWVFS